MTGVKAAMEDASDAMICIQRALQAMLLAEALGADGRVAGWKLPYIQNDQQALMAIAILAGLKIVNAVTHYLLSRA